LLRYGAYVSYYVAVAGGDKNSATTTSAQMLPGLPLVIYPSFYCCADLGLLAYLVNGGLIAASCTNRNVSPKLRTGQNFNKRVKIKYIDKMNIFLTKRREYPTVNI